MGIISLSAIKAFFETGDKPNQEEFSNTWDSFWHKFSSGILKLWGNDNLDPLYGGPIKAEITRIVNGQEEDFIVPVYLPFGKSVVFKKNGNTGGTVEEGDVLMQYDSTTGKICTYTFSSGDNTDITNYVKNSLGSSSLTQNIAGSDYEVSKHLGNSNASQLEVNDIALNVWFDSVTLWPQAKYLGGDATLITSWTSLMELEEINIL